MEYFHYNTRDYSIEKLNQQLLSNEAFIKSQKVLIVSGDSWTNRMVATWNCKDTDSWVPEYAKLRNYDFVIVSANGGDSATISFKVLVNLLTGVEVDYNMFPPRNNNTSWLESYQFKDKKVDVIVQWTSIIRDFSEFSAWYRPYTHASVPDLSGDTFKKEMHEEYISQIINEKYYSYKVQVYSWQLQKYFEKWNIPYYFWMGFCDLVPESVEGTDMDIRKFLNKDRWFNLYERPYNMADYLYLLENKTLPTRLRGIMTEGGTSGLKQTLSNYLVDLFKRNKDVTSLKDSFFLTDLHTNTHGNEIIAQTLNKKIPK